MTHYLFKIARRYELPFAVEREDLPDDSAAHDHAQALASIYPRASTITVVVESRTVERMVVDCVAPDHKTMKAVLESRALIAASRRLLDEPGSRPVPI